MKRRQTIKSSLQIVLIFTFLTASCIPSPKPIEIATPEPSLRSLAEARSISIGAAVDAGALWADRLYGKTLAREFNMVTPENEMKFASLQPIRNRYNFRDADTIVRFAKAHGMQVRGHTLVWHHQLPMWLIERRWTREELIEILREHISTVVGRYRGQVVAWDVVNEAIADDGSLRNTFWLQGIGPEYIEMAFRWAHEADPKALLFYNDYGGEGLGRKSDAIYALVRELLQRGVPIHGVGLQMHVSIDRYPKPQDVALNMERLSKLGLQIHITEMDVRIKLPATEEKLIQQARIYRDILEVALSTKNCTAFVMWGFTDLYSWIPRRYRGWGDALIFDEAYYPKPAYFAIRNVLMAR